MSRDWTFYLEDIADSAEKITRYVDGITVKGLAEDSMRYDAVVRNLEIIGEAAKKLPDEAKAKMPAIEWEKAARFRDVIAHHYYRLNMALIWDIVTNKVPAVRAAAQTVLKELGLRE